MQYEDLPNRWAENLKSHLREKGSDYDQLSATDFRDSLMLRFEDGSLAFFTWAFYLLDHDNNEIGVFTEHCGYHIFPRLGTKVELLESKWSETGGE